MHPTPSTARLSAFLLFAVLLPLGVRAAESLETVEKAAADLAKLRAETVRLESDWKARRGLLDGTINALAERARYLETQRTSLLARTATQRKQAEELQTTHAAASAQLATTKEHLDRLATQLLQLRPWLPSRLADALELPYRTLADASISPGERTQTIIKILNRTAQFNKVITCTDEVIAPEGETAPRMMEAIYWGLSHAYALDRSSHRAYFGHPGAQRWVWEPLAQDADAVARLLAIAKDQSDPAFVAAPAQISELPVEPKL